MTCSRTARFVLAATVAASMMAVAGASDAAVAVAKSYTDATGDNGTAADISTVTVDFDGDYFFVRAQVANLPALGSAGAAAAAMDTDRNPSTGALRGAEYLLFVDLAALEFNFLRWDGNDYVPANVREGDARFRHGSSSFEFHVRKSAIGDVSAFNFAVIAETGSADQGAFDLAPSVGSWSYELARAPAVTGFAASYAPAAPRAGASFRVARVTASLDDGTSIAADSYACQARVAGRTVRGTGTGGCTFRLPKAAKGKRLVVTVTATYAGVTRTVAPRTFVVR